MVILTEEKLKELNSFIQEIPTKYGVYLIEFFNKLIQEQKQQESISENEQTTI